MLLVERSKFGLNELLGGALGREALRLFGVNLPDDRALLPIDSGLVRNVCKSILSCCCRAKTEPQGSVGSGVGLVRKRDMAYSVRT